MIDKNKWEQYGYPRTKKDILGITLHETGNTQMNAKQLFEWMNDVNRSSNGCHYLCDDAETIQVMPDEYAVYHTGKGYDYGNEYTIAIEICSSLSDEKYQKAQDRAIELIKSLQKKYKLSNEVIYFHNSFDEKMYCPKTILDRYGSPRQFIKEELGG